MRNIEALVDQYNGKFLANETLPDQTAPLGYSCPVCCEVYHTAREAVECRDQPYDNGGLEVGDIVVLPGVYQNSIDINDPWLAFTTPKKPGTHTGYRVPFFVVTAIHAERREKHRCVVTLASLYDGRLRIGWNPANGEGHYEIFKLTGERKLNDYWMDRVGRLFNQCTVSEQVKEEAAVLAAMGLSTENLI